MLTTFGALGQFHDTTTGTELISLDGKGTESLTFASRPSIAT
ncbi:MAG TPA: hypothetical protein VH351_08955 [Bryobacteraceae bacterium]|jgi:hypothetical protein|nr:hypothetical protein [Bryobacteraceae bacterium]